MYEDPSYCLKNNRKESKFIVLIVTFHFMCACLTAIRKNMTGSKFGDLLLEAGLIRSESIKWVSSGKQSGVLYIATKWFWKA